MLNTYILWPGKKRNTLNYAIPMYQNDIFYHILVLVRYDDVLWGLAVLLGSAFSFKSGLELFEHERNRHVAWPQ